MLRDFKRRRAKKEKLIFKFASHHAALVTPHPSYGSATPTRAHGERRERGDAPEKVGRCRLTSAEQAARFGAATRRDVTLRYVTSRRHGEKIHSPWPRAKRARACHSADQPAKWTRPRWRRGDWRRVTERDPVRTAAAAAIHGLARARVRRTRGNEARRAIDGESTSRRGGEASRRPSCRAARCNGDVQVAACTRLVHGGTRARASAPLRFIYITRPLPTRAQHAFSRDEDRWRRLDAKKYINRVNICCVNSSCVSRNDFYHRDKRVSRKREKEGKRKDRDLVGSPEKWLCPATELLRLPFVPILLSI